jgi:arylsulfatase A-like enzyme
MMLWFENTGSNIMGRFFEFVPRLTLATAACIISACASPSQPQHVLPSEQSRPNVIVIVADDLGYNDLSAYGGSIQTPNIDRLAAGGVRMTSGYVTAAVCAPSRAAILSGRQQTRFGFEFNPVGRDQSGGMSLEETTIAETMRAAGYRTGMVGKWHVGQAVGFRPLDRGFERFFGILGGATPYLTSIVPDDLHVVTAEDQYITRDRLPIFDQDTRVDPDQYVTDLLTEQAIEFMGQSQTQPFFLYLAYTAPHTPLQAPARYLERAPADASDSERVYAAMVTSLDDGIGRLSDYLRSTGQFDNTLIIFVSDNGCPSYVSCSNAPLNGWKGYPWEGGIRVPYIVSWPDRLAPSASDAPVSSLDIAATAAAAAGVRHPGAEGVNLVESLEAPASVQSERALFWRMGPTRVVRSGRWKLITVNRSATAGGGDELEHSRIPDGMSANVSALGQWTFLYDLSSDPAERFDVAAQHPEVVAALQQQWENWNLQNVEPQWTSRRGVRGDVNGSRVELFN